MGFFKKPAYNKALLQKSNQKFNRKRKSINGHEPNGKVSKSFMNKKRRKNEVADDEDILSSSSDESENKQDEIVDSDFSEEEINPNATATKELLKSLEVNLY